MSNEQACESEPVKYWCLGCDDEKACLNKKDILDCVKKHKGVGILDIYEVTYTYRGTIVLEPRPRITIEEIKEAQDD